MRLVNCLILPLVTASIVSATCNLKKSGQIGVMALYYYTLTTVLGITLSVVLVETIKPGERLKNENVVSQNSTAYFMTVDTILDLFRNLVPENIVNACLNQVIESFTPLFLPFTSTADRGQYSNNKKNV